VRKCKLPPYGITFSNAGWSVAASEFPGAYACYGTLSALAKALPAPVLASVEKVAETRSQPLEAALSKAMTEIDDGLRRIRTTLAAVGRWQKRAKRIQKRITWRDHPELAPEKRERTKEKIRSVRLPDQQ
jgi:hypothetical protein